MTTKEKLSLLRNEMKANGLDAFVVFNADPHMSEYFTPYWEERKWISSFDSSAGYIFITHDKAVLWTDGRYLVQAKNELTGTGVDFFIEGTKDAPLSQEWLLNELPQGAKVGCNGLCTPHNTWNLLSDTLKRKRITLVDKPLIEKIWKDRPKDDRKPIYVRAEKYTGRSTSDKLATLRGIMAEKGVTHFLVTALDDIAWVTNLRGNDVNFNPVFLAYLCITPKSATLFVDTKQCDDSVKAYLKEQHIELKDYHDYFKELQKLKGETILLSPDANQTIYNTVGEHNTLHIAPSPVQLLKAVKNETELEGFRKAMVKDGVALVNFFYWLENNIGKTPLTEHSLGDIMDKFRAEQGFLANSFGKIIGYEGNGAIVHYHAATNPEVPMHAKGTVLIDSGAHYIEGTTDITRVIPLGEFSEDFKRDYTLVMKAMITLSTTIFPAGTRGVQLDSITRAILWKNQRDYGHGTGHGVGSYLCVHEGPQSIRKEMRDVPMLEHMVCSNEPGIYCEGRYGIRIENLVAVQKHSSNEFGDFYRLETLTLCPLDTRAVIVDMLTEEERQWLNNYNQWVEKTLSPLVGKEQQAWLKERCKAI
ncbi:MULTISPECIES: aminopeptidase P family protein [Capnocytophaga]|jgi:xaa-pro aminopeptidase 1|uniref:aminopeptidase P family protein n=1 Tax=Capnocytophaga TaxID=1016 RepID=UPI00027C4133|nr:MULTISPECIES: aminopeptidase P family protein [Capnocytophaga]EJU31379.1 metallopeptidase family M24 [Capnocytophaga sp. CM59]